MDGKKKKYYKSRSELANELNISRRTLYTKLKKAGLKLSPGDLSPVEQAEIYKALGISTKKT